MIFTLFWTKLNVNTRGRKEKTKSSSTVEESLYYLSTLWIFENNLIVHSTFQPGHVVALPLSKSPIASSKQEIPSALSRYCSVWGNRLQWKDKLIPDFCPQDSSSELYFRERSTVLYYRDGSWWFKIFHIQQQTLFKCANNKKCFLKSKSGY